MKKSSKLVLKVLSLVGSVFAIVVIIAAFGGSNFAQKARASITTSTTETITVTVNQVITLVTSSTLALPALTPGTPVYATTSAIVTTNAAAGWQLDISRSAASTTTMASGSIQFPDNTPVFNGSNATTAANLLPGGTGNGLGLSFRVYQTGTSAGLYVGTTTWGTDDTVPNALWAGIPTSTIIAITTTTYTGTAQTIVFGARANAPATQQATTYTGQITVTAIALP